MPGHLNSSKHNRVVMPAFCPVSPPNHGRSAILSALLLACVLPVRVSRMKLLNHDCLIPTVSEYGKKFVLSLVLGGNLTQVQFDSCPVWLLPSAVTVTVLSQGGHRLWWAEIRADCQYFLSTHSVPSTLLCCHLIFKPDPGCQFCFKIRKQTKARPI